MDDLLNEFLTETSESIDVVDVELVKLEQDPNNADVLDNIFRLVHTIKGTCGFLGLPRLEAIAHASENLLGKFRDREIEVTREAVSVVLASLDRIKEIIAVLEETEQEPEGDDSELIAELDALIENGGQVKGKSGPRQDQDSAGQGANSETEADEAKPADTDGADSEDEVDPKLGRELKPGEVSLDELERAFQEAPGPESPASDDDAQAGSNKSDMSLFERMGGNDTITVVSHLLANRIVSDEKLEPFFGESSEDVRKARFLGLLTSIAKEDERATETVAKTLVDKPGFGDPNFEALVSLAKSIFEEVGFDTDTRDEACMAFELIRDRLVVSADDDAADDVAAAESKGADQVMQQGGEKRSTQSIRVSVDLLEDLMNMVSELVLTRNQLLQMVRQMEDSEFAVPLQRLSQCTTELQEGVMKTRMQPIGNAWAKLPRIVRDLTVDLDKRIDLDMRGSETELDRQVLELIKDPLTHMVRNSADHGIETPTERLALGKPETGTIRLNAYHEGGHIIIEIADDGRGVSAESIANKAVEKGLVTRADLEEMSDSQIQKFIFHPGFSTAAKVTNVSGRGVGMDVVRSNIEKIGGTIDMHSVESKGTTFQIKIPLTLAIVSSLIVEASGERFAIPQISVLELVRASQESDYTIEKIKDTPVLRLRNRLLPLVYLNQILGFEENGTKKDHDESEDFIVVTQVGAFTFGIVVDQVYDTEEIVVKPVAPILKELPIYSGNTILGDGSVIMILDPNGIATQANSSVGDREQGFAEEEVAAVSQQSNKEALLVFRAGNDSQKAVPLSLIARLEDIERDKIEESDGRHVVQYRGNLMPIVLVEGSQSLVEEGRQPVLVFSDGEYTMGLAVQEIMDIVEDDLDIKLGSENVGMVGSAVINGKATEIIDVAYYLRLAFNEWLSSRDTQERVAPKKDSKVLLIDDSAFFRNMLKPLLQVAGYRVTAVENAEEALALREEGHEFDLIISDIDMPGMDGFELAEVLKKGGRWQDVPLVALTALASQKDFSRGREVGFNDYIAKFDREALLHSLSQQLKMQGDAA